MSPALLRALGRRWEAAASFRRQLPFLESVTSLVTVTAKVVAGVLNRRAVKSASKKSRMARSYGAQEIIAFFGKCDKFCNGHCKSCSRRSESAGREIGVEKESNGPKLWRPSGVCAGEGNTRLGALNLKV